MSAAMTGNVAIDYRHDPPWLACTQADLHAIANLQVEPCSSDLTFSVSASGVWPYVVRGQTPGDLRVFVGGLNPMLDAIAAEVLRRRGLGGRFKITGHGVTTDGLGEVLQLGTAPRPLRAW